MAVGRRLEAGSQEKEEKGTERVALGQISWRQKIWATRAESKSNLGKSEQHNWAMFISRLFWGHRHAHTSLQTNRTEQPRIAFLIY